MAEECPNIANHTECPDGYIARQEWAYRKGRRHKPVRCLVCGLWAIWVRRPKGEADYGGHEEKWRP